MNRIYREVVRAEESWRGQSGRLSLVLLCGHTLRRKYSQGAPSRARCIECENVMGGGGSTYFDTEAKMKHWQIWDAETGLPADRSAQMSQEEIEEWVR